MNKAQKRAWLCFAVSLSTLLIASVLILFIWVNEIDVTAINRTAFKIFSLLWTIPLILMVVISARLPGKYNDERDKLIELRALKIGAMGVFIFLAGAIYFLFLIIRVDSIRTLSIVWLVYLAAFVWFFVSSVAALIQYGWGGKQNE